MVSQKIEDLTKRWQGGSIWRVMPAPAPAGPKPGWRTSEFWAVVFTVVPMVLGAVEEVLPPRVALPVAGVLAAVYVICRTGRKILDQLNAYRTLGQPNELLPRLSAPLFSATQFPEISVAETNETSGVIFDGANAG